MVLQLWFFVWKPLLDLKFQWSVFWVIAGCHEHFLKKLVLYRDCHFTYDSNLIKVCKQQCWLCECCPACPFIHRPWPLCIDFLDKQSASQLCSPLIHLFWKSDAQFSSWLVLVSCFPIPAKKISRIGTSNALSVLISNRALSSQLYFVPFCKRLFEVKVAWRFHCWSYK